MTLPVLLECPVCHNALLAPQDAGYACQSERCGIAFPSVNGVPIFINESNSVFRFSDFTGAGATIFDTHPTLKNRMRDAIRPILPWLPNIGQSLCAKRNYDRLISELQCEATAPLVLVIGTGRDDKGLAKALLAAGIKLVETDVYLSPRVNLIVDAHDLPFPNGSFDGVVAQTVLEHVVDPSRCVAEMHRILKQNGTAYAETPFMQQVHNGAYDFTRFTLLGHRRLFRWFQEIDAGMQGGPGMALSWSIAYFLWSFWPSKLLMYAVMPLFLFWIKYFDYLLARRPSATDAASEFYFIGRRSDSPLSDRDLITQYWTAKGERKIKIQEKLRIVTDDTISPDRLSR